MKALYKDLENKNIVVTGGGRGLGFAIAKGFVENNARVVIVGRDGARLETAGKELGGNVRCFPFDLNDIDLIPGLVATIIDAVGVIDVLVNNAGINLKKDALTVTNDEYRGIVQVNQTAVFALSREIARSMVEHGSGNIIMISSMASQYGIPKIIGYAATKSAVEGMTRAMAVEWSPRGVRVNCIAPGFIVTDMSSKALDSDPERKKRVLDRTPLGKLGESLDVANAVLFLASDRSKFITGVVLPVDGGNSIGF